MMVNVGFAARCFRLIAAGVALFDELPAEHDFIRSLDGAFARLTARRAFPGAEQECTRPSDRADGVRCLIRGAGGRDGNNINATRVFITDLS